jgi:YD repeat-containing protein
LSEAHFGGGVGDDFNDTYYYLYSYNQAGRVTSQEMALQTSTSRFLVSPWLIFTAAYQWDNEGRMTSMQYPAVTEGGGLWTPPTAGYTYDANGRMSGMTWDLGNGGGPQPFASATYGPAGEMLTLWYGAGTETRTYNSLLQLTSQVVPGYLNMHYNYSATQNNGRITGSVDGIWGESTGYSYDALNRLSTAANGLWAETYSYDGFGNLTGKAGVGGAPSMTASYDAANHFTSGQAARRGMGSGMRSFRGLLACSTALAALSFFIPLIYKDWDFASLLIVSSLCSVLWLGMLLYSLKTIGRRGRWLLVGLPLCLLWPLSALLVWASCRLGLDCL